MTEREKEQTQDVVLRRSYHNMRYLFVGKIYKLGIWLAIDREG